MLGIGKSILAILIFLLSFLVYKYHDYVEFYEIITLNDESAKSRCLDGSPFAFYFKKGKDSGKSKFIMYFEGGGWCGFSGKDSLESCYYRSSTLYGSTNSIVHKLFYFPVISKYFTIMSSNPNDNPEFHNYNKVYLKYCDGVGYIGNMEKPLDFSSVYYSKSGKPEKKTLYFRGMYNVLETFDYLKKREKELDIKFTDASDILLAGTSAGGQAVVIYSNFLKNHFKKILNPNVRVFSLVDSGVFLSVLNPKKNVYIHGEMWQQLSHLIENKEVVKSYCDFTLDGPNPNFSDCFLIDTKILDNIQVPILLLQSLNDNHSLNMIMGSDCHTKPKIKKNNQMVFDCTDEELKFFDNYRQGIVKIFKNTTNKLVSYYLSHCINHCFFYYSNSMSLPLVDNQQYGEMTPDGSIKSFIKEYEQNYYDKNLQLSQVNPIRVVDDSINSINSLHKVCEDVRDLYYYLVNYNMKLDDILEPEMKK